MKINEARVKEFFSILKNEAIRPVFQPIVSLKDGSILAYEALSRITLKDAQLSIGELFEMADQMGQAWNLEKLCRGRALKAAAKKPDGAKIFLNVDANIMLDMEFVRGFTMESLKKYGLKTQDIVFELTERSSVEDKEIFKKAVEHYKGQGFEIAIDDVGAGYSNLNRIGFVEPHYIKIDMELIRNIHLSKSKCSMVEIMTSFCKEMNYILIAEGIETVEELRALIQMGVTYGQGYLFQRPSKNFKEIAKEVEDTIIAMQNSEKVLSFVPSFFGTVETICTNGLTILPERRATEAYELFEKNIELLEICVVDESKNFLGILTRAAILRYFSGMYGYTLHQKYTVAELMKKETLSVNADFSIENVSKMAMERLPTEIYDDVVVLKERRYLGIVSIKDLLSVAITIQVKRATEANPLTALPGNLSIEKQIEQLLGDTSRFAIMYLDLDNFKAYNDAYGFNSGDRMIKALAESMRNACNQKDFLGHIGGDDFVLITRCKDIEQLGESIIHNFKTYLKELYNTMDWERGFIISKNRNGLTEKFPIASLSIAVVTNQNEIFYELEHLSKVIVKTKKAAKHVYGDSVVIY